MLNKNIIRNASIVLAVILVAYAVIVGVNEGFQVNSRPSSRTTTPASATTSSTTNAGSEELVASFKMGVNSVPLDLNPLKQKYAGKPDTKVNDIRLKGLKAAWTNLAIDSQYITIPNGTFQKSTTSDTSAINIPKINHVSLTNQATKISLSKTLDEGSQSIMYEIPGGGFLRRKDYMTGRNVKMETNDKLLGQVLLKDLPDTITMMRPEKQNLQFYDANIVDTQGNNMKVYFLVA
jgi:hypothetical protein